MSTAASPIPGTLISDRDDQIKFGAVHLSVTDVTRSLGFWRDAVGLTVQGTGVDGDATLGVGDRAIVVLHAGAERASAAGSAGVAGLYHLAIHVPSAQELARMIMRLAEHGIHQRPTDHLAAMVTYTVDPDGIGLEVTLETPARFDRIQVTATDVFMLAPNGQRHPVVAPLDVSAVLATLNGAEPHGRLAPPAFLGHVHLHVADIHESAAFYRDLIGFTPNPPLGPNGMADFTAGGTAPHRLAINNWAGPNARQAKGTAGLLYFEVTPEADALSAIAQRAAAAGHWHHIEGDRLFLRDPAGNTLALLPRAPAA